MSRRRARTTYWVIDLKQLSFWLAGAFVAGSLPNLVDAVSTWLLLLLAFIAALAGSLIWLLNVRKKGVGVYIYLPKTDDKPLPEKAARARYKKISKNHRDWFRSGPDTPQRTVSERAEWLLSTITHRLDEAEYRDGEYPPIFLYIEARLEEAFALGRKYSEHQAAQQGAISVYEPDSSQQAPLNLQVRSFSTHEGKNYIYSVDLSKAVPPNHNKESHSKSLRIDTRYNISPARSHSSPRLAVIIHAAGDSDRMTQDAFLQQTVFAAAAGTPTNGYSVTEDDLCQHAVFFGIQSTEFTERLKTGTANAILGEIFEHRRRISSELYGTSEVPVRLFMQGPSILAFAAGGTFPEGSKYIPYLKNKSSTTAKITSSEDSLIAIIDGDDIGTETEKHLLDGNLEQAVLYSERVDTSIHRLIETIQKLPDAEVISSGGDSAIVSLIPSALDEFHEAINTWRNGKEIRVSCGIGDDCREAFIALRKAKTSGKNTTIHA